MIGMAGAALGSAGIDMIGGIAQNAQNAKQAADNRAFQERMSNTAYQRAMVDMKQAGLNPMLAYRMGGASTPMGGQAQMQNVAGSAVNTGLEVARSKADINKKSSEIDKISQEISNLKETENLTKQQTDNLAEAMIKIRAETEKIRSENIGISADNAKKKALETIFKENPSAAWIDVLKSKSPVGAALTGGSMTLVDQLSSGLDSIWQKIKSWRNK
ncbi:DNA pilot protein [Microviridae sp.]|nr:DNA pilot protein [Microviridae sp.]